MIEEIEKQIGEHQAVMTAIAGSMGGEIVQAVECMVHAFKNGKKLLVMGNGGSAADSQHFVAEMIGRFKMERAALPAVALSTDTSILTCLGNDYGFDSIFRRQVEALAASGDVVVGISTSGNSPNIIKAVEQAQAKKIFVVGFLGGTGGKLKDKVDLPIIIPSVNTQRIQEGHITIAHIICELVETELFG